MNISPLVYALVLNYHSLEDTLQCVDSLRHADYPSLKILVIDNDSPKNEGKVLSENLAQDEFIQLPKNIGYTGGNNVGIKQALDHDAEFIFIVNPDVRVPKGCIQNYISILINNPEIGALNPIQLNSEGNGLDEKFSRGIYTYQNREIPSLSDLDKADLILDSNTLYGAAIILPSKVLKKVGGFDPIYFAYGEEEDLCRRIKFFGYKLAVTNQSPIKHLRTKEENKNYRWRILFLRLRGKYLFILKNPKSRFLICLKRSYKEFIEDFRNRANLDYPYKLSHFISIGSWLIINIIRIFMHRKTDHKPSAYIS
ncbi:hypothetical protein MTYM_01631 [Methylococcales bacterium]|nr:hypothetical protein MTYM_01631 [Methylococcales bacterium]